MKKIILVLFSFAFYVMVSCFFGVSTVLAKTPEVIVKDEGYAAKYISQSIPDPIEIEAGKTVTVVVKFKNVGTKTWDSSSKNYISAYTMEPRYHTSVLKGANWLGNDQTAKIVGKIKPGQTGELSLELKASTKIGTYTEQFYLAVDGYSWVKDGYFFVKVKVVPAKTAVKNTKEIYTDRTDPVVKSGDYSVNMMMQNVKEITAKGGEKVLVVLGYQNVGKNTWNTYSLVANQPSALVSANQLSFADDMWQSPSVVVERIQPIPQWKVAREDFYMKAPDKKGSYVFTVKLAVDNQTLEDTAIHIPVNVTEDAPMYDSSDIQPVIPRLTEEPRIRVGIWKDPDTEIQFVSDMDDYRVFDGETEIGLLAKNTIAVLGVKSGLYSLKGPDLTLTTSSYIRLVPANDVHAVFTLKNYDRKVSWKGPRPFNAYRGAMEYRTTQDGKATYVINDLMFEDYIAGIAETSNASPIEYIKALLTAARTYAYYIMAYSGKHDVRNFDVVANTGDQLYLGYVSEQLMPRVKQASDETRGFMITYDIDKNPITPNDIVITPYYGNSDGRTRDWTDVWGGKAKPWLVSVEATYDARDGKKMNGHGVGMSARDAAVRADEAGLDWVSLLKYYYSGVEVEKIY